MAKKKVNLFKSREQKDENERLSDKSYLDDFIPEEKKIEKTTVASKEEIKTKPKREVGEEIKPEIKRATIVVLEESLAEFRNIIHTIKKSGDYEYTQKDAFARAIELLRSEVVDEYGPLLQAPPPRKGRW